MYRKDPVWNEYYRETEPRRRKELLNAAASRAPEDEVLPYRRLFFEKRHSDHGKLSTDVDLYLFQCVNFIQLARASRLFRRSGEKELRSVIGELGFREAEAAGEAGKAALYWEIRNAVRRYIKSCGDGSYRRMVFGLIGTSDKDRKKQICEDIWHMTNGLARKFGMEEELSLWKEAVLDEYAGADYEAMDRFREYDARMTGKSS